MKLRYFYKIDQNKNPIPASNIRRKSKPPGRQWREIFNFCCVQAEVGCFCEPRYFIQLDHKGNPIDYTLIKRDSTPKLNNEGLKYGEIQSPKQECCGIVNWQFNTPNSIGSLIINDDGSEVVNSITDSHGFIIPEDGSSIEVIVENIQCPDVLTPGFILSVKSEDGTLNYTSTVTPNYTFVFDATKRYTVTVTSTCS
jgi:hypothetical protein